MKFRDGESQNKKLNFNTYFYITKFISTNLKDIILVRCNSFIYYESIQEILNQLLGNSVVKCFQCSLEFSNLPMRRHYHTTFFLHSLFLQTNEIDFFFVFDTSDEYKDGYCSMPTFSNVYPYSQTRPSYILPLSTSLIMLD